MAISLQQFQTARHRQEFHHNAQKNADGSCQRWRKNGEVKTWKTRPGEFRVPVKYGLKTCDYITEKEAADFHLPEECAAHRAGSWLDEKVPRTKPSLDEKALEQEAADELEGESRVS